MKTNKELLQLALKTKWFNLIKNGEKKEEYREIKPYWISRFIRNEDGTRIKKNDAITLSNNVDLLNLLVRNRKKILIPFKEIHFTRGYNPNGAFTCEVLNIRIDTGIEEWGAARGKYYFVFEIKKLTF